MSPGGITGLLKSQRAAAETLKLLVRKQHLDEVDAAKILQQISRSPLLAPAPNDFHACRKKCWIPVPHRHFRINDYEDYVAFSIQAAVVLLDQLKALYGLPVDDVARIQIQIEASDLPLTSDVDVVFAAYRDHEQQQDAETLLTITGLLDLWTSRVRIGALVTDDSIIWASEENAEQR